MKIIDLVTFPSNLSVKNVEFLVEHTTLEYILSLLIYHTTMTKKAKSIRSKEKSQAKCEETVSFR